MTNEIQTLINALQKEVKEIKVESEKEDALLRLEEIAKEYSGEDKIISSLDLAEMMKNRPAQTKIMSGYKELDDILDGFRHKQLIVLSGATKSGKTSFAIEITSRIKDFNPMWLPFEEPAEELIQKFLDRNEQPPLFYTPQRILGNTLLWVEKKIIESKAKYNSQVVFIDHLHFLVDFGDNMSQEIGKTMRSLKRLAVKWNIVIVLIAHLRKTKIDAQPDLDDLRDSSFIAQEADTVVIVWRETKKEAGEIIITNNINVSVQANRRTGKTGNVKMVYENGKFLMIDWRPEAKAESEYNSWGKKW